jgi:hypothetical protein
MPILNSIKASLRFKSPVEWFYQNAEIVKVEWWLSWCHEYPDLFWARLRIFSDGKADVLFQDGNKLFGFDNEEYAGYFVSEDEFGKFENLDEEDKTFLKIPKDTNIQTPIWKNNEVKNFIYIGKY